MNTLRHGAIAAALAFAATGLAFAKAAPQFADPATMTDDEKATVQLLHDFTACTYKVRAENRKMLVAARAQADEIASARSAAAEDASRKAMREAGIPESKHNDVLNVMKSYDSDLILYTLMDAISKDPMKTCLAEMKLDAPGAQEDLEDRLDSIAKKYGRAVLEPKNQ